jgi:large subunit ribosomal protein L15
MDLKTVCAKGLKYKARSRVGRGIGSGSGKTCGRGHKGRGARSGASRRPGYEGGQMPIYRRVPKRGFTNARFRTDYTTINVDKLNAFSDGDVVDLQGVLDHGLVSKNTALLKVLGNGDLTRKLTVRAQKCSASAVEKILAAGGEFIALDGSGKAQAAETVVVGKKKPKMAKRDKSADMPRKIKKAEKAKLAADGTGDGGGEEA